MIVYLSIWRVAEFFAVVRKVYRIFVSIVTVLLLPSCVSDSKYEPKMMTDISKSQWEEKNGDAALPLASAMDFCIKEASDESAKIAAVLFLDKMSYITEGSSSNFWILNKNNILITRSLDGKILAGITRDSILNCAKNKNIKVEEKKISLDDINDCKEAFITSASSFVTPVIQVDNIKINNGKVGEFSNLLRKTYLELND